MALGAEGVNMGTRFLATKECTIHQNVKQALVDHDERSTNLIFRSLKNTARVAKNSVSDEVVKRLAVPGATFADIQSLVAGVKGAVVLEQGDLDADAIVNKRLQGFVRR